jgi:prepilin-type processing-associated H-X9-DG protein
MEQSENRHIQTVSNDTTAEAVDHSHTMWTYVKDHLTGNVIVADWMTAMLPYLNSKTSDGDGIIPQTTIPAVFKCPSDPYLDYNPAGYWPGPNVDYINNSNYFAASYGINIDIACVKDPTAQYSPTTFDRSGTSAAGIIGVFNGPTSPAYGATNIGDGANARLDKVVEPSTTLLLGDCGNQPYDGSSSQDRQDSLAYTTNYMVYNGGIPAEWGTLAGIMQTSWLRARVPLTRHDSNATTPAGGGSGIGGRINIAFCDGHCESVQQAFFKNVKVTPWSLGN